MSLYTSLNIGKQALAISQMGVQVTSQNIANVNTQGYKRQRLNQVNMPNGMGVTMDGISRLQNTFAEKQLLGVTSTAARSATTSESYRAIESLFDEMSGRGLDLEFRNFFKSLQDLSANPGGTAERATLRSQGESIGRVFGFMSQKLNEQMRNQDLDLQNIMAEANGLTQQIADLSRRISVMIGNETGSNELRNTRDECVRRLAELMPIATHEDINGNFTVSIRNGMPLVSGGQFYTLRAEPDVTNDLKNNIVWVSDEGIRQDVTRQMTSGKISGILETRDVLIPQQLEKLDRLAAEFVLIFNEQHRAGSGLDGVSGRNFFEPLEVFTHIGKGSRGQGSVSAASVLDETALTLDKYEIRFTDNGLGGLDYSVINTSSGATIQSGNYVSGAAIAFDGISVAISDTAGGPPLAGDFFRVDTVSGAASNFRVSDAVRASLDAIGAGFTGQPGDNQNVLILADMENRSIAAGATMSFIEMYHSMIVELGVRAAAEDAAAESDSAQLTQVQNLADSVSGVNIDEEAISLMQYQHAYQAASRVISAVDELLRTLINLIA